MQIEHISSHEFFGKVDWADLSDRYQAEKALEPVSGFVVGDEFSGPQSKDDFIMNKLWDILHANMGKDVRILVQIRKGS